MKYIHANQHIKALKKKKNNNKKIIEIRIEKENVGHGKVPHFLLITLTIM